MRVGQKNGLVYQWTPKGSRPSQPADQRYESAYMFGAVCPARDTGAALVMPDANTAAMQKHLDEISRTVAAGAHAIVLLDRAGWHTTAKLKAPNNLTLLPIPAGEPRTQCRRKHLAVPAPDLPLEPRLRNLRRHHRRLLRGLAKARDRGRPHPFHRKPKLGVYQSSPMKAGISWAADISAGVVASLGIAFLLA